MQVCQNHLMHVGCMAARHIVSRISLFVLYWSARLGAKQLLHGGLQGGEACLPRG